MICATAFPTAQSSDSCMAAPTGDSHKYHILARASDVGIPPFHRRPRGVDKKSTSSPKKKKNAGAIRPFIQVLTTCRRNKDLGETFPKVTQGAAPPIPSLLLWELARLTRQIQLTCDVQYDTRRKLHDKMIPVLNSTGSKSTPFA